MSSAGQNRTRRLLKVGIAALSALALAIAIVMLMRRSTAEPITFRIVNGQTGEPVTNVNVIEYRLKSVLFREAFELLDLGTVRSAKVPVNATGVAQVTGPRRRHWVTVDFEPAGDFARVSFASPYGAPTVTRSKTNQVHHRTEAFEQGTKIIATSSKD